MTHALDVIALGNAIVDLLGPVDDAFLDTHRLEKGGMALIDDTRAQALTEAFSPDSRMAGGSAGNTVACLASLGGKGGFLGKVADDELGNVYRESMEELGVIFPAPPAKTGATGRCIVAVTPDAERTMSTFLGAAGDLGPDDVDEAAVRDAAITYFEGYLFSSPTARDAFAKAARIARDAGRKTAISLSATFIIDMHRDQLLQTIKDDCDIVFANEEEANALFGTHDSAEDLAKRIEGMAELVVVTRSERGSVIVDGSGTATEVDAIAPKALVDTTGAGDAYAGGFLFGLVRDMSMETCGKLGSLAASEVISHMGPRPQTPLHVLAVEKGLL